MVVLGRFRKICLSGIFLHLLAPIRNSHSRQCAIQASHALCNCVCYCALVKMDQMIKYHHRHYMFVVHTYVFIPMNNIRQCEYPT